MSLLQCPECKRSFREPGFCPYDGKPLSNHASETIQSAMIDVPVVAPSQPPPSNTIERAGFAGPRSDAEHRGVTIDNPTEMDEPRSTFPLHGGRAGSSTNEPQTITKVRAVSAATGDISNAIAQMSGDPRSEYDRLVGATLDERYFIQRKIGEGGMGVVFAVRHKIIERPLAIKVLKREVMRDSGTIRRFVQEAKAASRIGHPNIVDVTDFGQTPDGLTYSVMEYVDGDTLSASIRHGAPFQLDRAVRIAAQIARALGVAHDKGIVHRDLKPENVFLVDRDGRPDFVKIVDFGIAKVMPLSGDPNLPRLTKAGSVFGTPEYMAPEQAAGRGDTDGRVDIYALGVILYEMIVGRVPHRGDTMVRTLAMQMLDAVIPPSQARPDLTYPPDLENLVLRALSKKREQRYQTMGEMLEALDQVARDVLPLPVSRNAAGSAVYAMPALPPGADPSALIPISVMPPVTGPQPAQTGASAQIAAVPATPTQRKLHEPEFVTASRVPTFDHVVDIPRHSASGSRWPIVIGGLLGLGAITAGAIYAISRDNPAQNPPVIDAQVVAKVTPDGQTAPVIDAQVVAEVPADAGIDAPHPDAAIRIVVHRDGGVLQPPPHVDATAIAIAPPQHKPVRVTIMTKPDTARVFVDGHFRGGGGTTLEEEYGSKVAVECRAPGYKTGKLDVTFDGSVEVTLCAMQRIKICIDNIKNPFDDCEVDPSRPSPDPTLNNGSGSNN